VNIRRSGAVLDHFRASGPGWQTRINAILEEVAAREARTKTKALRPAKAPASRGKATRRAR
jgi:hypothetical protein